MVKHSGYAIFMSSLRRTRTEYNEALFRAPSILGVLGLMRSNQNVWLTRYLRHVSTIWPVLMLAKLSLLAGTIQVALLPEYVTLPMIAALVAMTVIDVAMWSLHRSERIAKMPPYRQMWLMCGLAFAAGASTDILVHAMPEALINPAMSQLIVQYALALLAMCVFGHQRVLGLLYFLGAGIFSIGLHSGNELTLFCAIILAMALSTVLQAKFDRQRLVAMQLDEASSKRAQRLLTDYEESGRGWFWETDRTGALSYISGSLSRSMRLTAEELTGRQLTELVVMDAVGDVDRTLGFHLSSRSAFSDIAVRAALSDDERWWAISGRPVFNEFGQFQGFRGSGSDLTEMKRSQAEVARLAQFDSLTGLANRVQMQRALEQSIVDVRGHNGACALFLLDLDRFKAVNDTMGHPAGDALLQQVSQRLQRIVGERGMVGRLGGDEFKVVLPGFIDRPKLAVLAEAIIATLSQPYVIEGTQVVIGASIGVSLCPDDGETVDALVRNADLALYAAKADGRGVHRFYSSDMLAEAEDRRQLEEELRKAIATGGLELVYQPVVSATTEKIVGFEALLRWDHPVRGPISPAAFVPIAEESGLIGAMGEWVMRTACDTAAQWPEGLRVAVNVSPIQFSNPALPGIVMNALASSGLSPERLELEITESAFLNEGDARDQMFAQLKAIGVRLALDDFGTGYSSLGYLKKAPFDKIKIDQSFVRGAAVKGNRNAAIITSIVSLAEALGMDTTAEGVETHDELALVRSLGCSQIQGFIYGKGISKSEIERMFEKQGVEAKPSGFKSSRPRRSTMLRTVAIFHDGQRYVGRIRNISSSGAMIEGLWNVPAGTVFRIGLADGMTVGAEARWSVDDRMGVQFAQTVDVRAIHSAAAVRLAS